MGKAVPGTVRKPLVATQYSIARTPTGGDASSTAKEDGPRAWPGAFVLGPFRAGSTNGCATNLAGRGIANSRQQAQLFISPGLGWGVRGGGDAWSPPPQPSPARGEGVIKLSSAMAYGSFK